MQKAKIANETEKKNGNRNIKCRIGKYFSNKSTTLCIKFAVNNSIILLTGAK